MSQRGLYVAKQHERLSSSTSGIDYDVIGLLGTGTFGQVVKCQRVDTKAMVAIKIISNRSHAVNKSKSEVSFLRRFSSENIDEYNIVRAFECFTHITYPCLVFEMLDECLYTFLRRRNFEPLPLKCIRPILQQLLSAFAKLKELGVIHTDIKPENIMLVDQQMQPFRIKIIDFGSAIHIQKAVPLAQLQTPYYRSPEVLLGLPYGHAIDIWSVGCVIAELYLGVVLYCGATDHDTITYIIQTHGLPSTEKMRTGFHVPMYFNNYVENGHLRYKLKTREEYSKLTWKSVCETRTNQLNCLDDIRNFNFPTDLGGSELLAEKADRCQFVDLLKELLKLDEKRRFTPNEAIIHNFISMSYLREFSDCSNVRESIQLMKVCRREGRASESVLNVTSPPVVTDLVSNPTALFMYPESMANMELISDLCSLSSCSPAEYPAILKTAENRKLTQKQELPPSTK